FDRSGSTQHQWSFMQRAVAGFVARLRAQDRAAIGVFDFELEMLSSWDDSLETTLEALGATVRPGRMVGGTDFYGAIERTVRREFRDVEGRRAVVVLTDGRDTSLYRTATSRNRVIPGDEDRDFRRTLERVAEA